MARGLAALAGVALLLVGCSDEPTGMVEIPAEQREALDSWWASVDGKSTICSGFEAGGEDAIDGMADALALEDIATVSNEQLAAWIDDACDPERP